MRAALREVWQLETRCGDVPGGGDVGRLLTSCEGVSVFGGQQTPIATIEGGTHNAI